MWTRGKQQKHSQPTNSFFFFFIRIMMKIKTIAHWARYFNEIFKLETLKRFVVSFVCVCVFWMKETNNRPFQENGKKEHLKWSFTSQINADWNCMIETNECGKIIENIQFNSIELWLINKCQRKWLIKWVTMNCKHQL